MLVVSPEEGQVGRPQSEVLVTGRVVGEGRGDKILVFHYKRKKQYKKLAGHRQPFTAVRITEIAFDGQRFTAPEEPEKPAKAKKAKPAAEAEVETPAGEQEAPKVKAQAGGATKKARKSSAKSGGPTDRRSRSPLRKRISVWRTGSSCVRPCGRISCVPSCDRRG